MILAQAYRVGGLQGMGFSSVTKVKMLDWQPGGAAMSRSEYGTTTIRGRYTKNSMQRPHSLG